MTAEIIEHDDIARLECWNQKLLDIGQKNAPVDRSVENAGCGDPVMTQSRQKGQCLPVAMGNPGSQSLTFAATTVRARHVGLGPGFVDKDQTGGIYVGLITLPEPALARDVRPVLLAGQHAFFLKLIPSDWKKRESMPVSA